MNDYIKLLLCFIISFILCFLLSKFHINHINSVPKDQIEVENVKPKHKFKSLGGIQFLISTLFSFILFNINSIENKHFFVLIFVTIYYALIGLIDDLIKILAKDNKGLSGYVRIILEIIGVFIIINTISINLVEFIRLKQSYLYIGGLAFIYVIICVLGSCNAVNLTDGLDGLVCITYILAITPFLYISLIQYNFMISSFIISLIGSLLAYLCFNFNPSKLIMGDVGSIPLGALISIIAILLNKEILLLICLGVYILEAISVILQVGYFKISKGKRILKMAPLHYHFIKSGMKESNVVLLFVVISIVLSIITTLIGVIT